MLSQAFLIQIKIYLFGNHFLIKTMSIQKEDTILYEDPICRVTKDYLTILKYYFPIPISKKIDLSDIKVINVMHNFEGSMWGTSPGHMDTWFALDSDREKKKQYIELQLKDSDIKPCFSPNSPLTVIQMIQKYATVLVTEQNAPKEEIKTQCKECSSTVQQKGLGQKIKEKAHLVGDKVSQIGEKAKQSFKSNKESLENTLKQKKQEVWPQKTTTQKAKEKLKQAQNKAKQVADKTKQKAKEAAKQAEDKAKQLADKAKQTFKQNKEYIETKAKQTKEAAQKKSKQVKKAMQQANS